MQTAQSRAASVLIATLCTSVSAQKPLTVDWLIIRVRPSVAQEPAAIRVTLEIAPSNDNRYVVIAADSGIYARSSQIPLDGARASRRHELVYEGLPAGNYLVNAALFDARGQRATAWRRVTVAGDSDHSVRRRRTRDALR